MPELEELKTILVRMVDQAINTDWKRALIYAELRKDDHSIIYGRYDTATNEEKSFSLSPEIYDVLWQLIQQQPYALTQPCVKVRMNIRPDKFDSCDLC